MLRVLAVVLLAMPMTAFLISFKAEAQRWGKSYFPNANVVTQDGKTLRFYDDLIKDKVFVISFLFTTCRDVCPLAAARLAELQEKLGDSMGRHIFFYSISIDPETDTPERLKEYADAFRAGPGWLFLTGKPEDIRAIRYKLGDRSNALSDHRNEVLLGNGATGEWARNTVLGDLDSLALTVRAMDPKWRADAGAIRKGPKTLRFDLASRPGQALYTRLCAGCHTVGRGDKVGPDLLGVMGRRDRAWLVKYISNPEKMRAQKDAVALALASQFRAVRMPAMGISETDASDLLAHIAHLESRHAKRLRPLESLFPLTTHEGIRLVPEFVKGQPVAVVFGFTHCPDVCPTMLQDWSNVLAEMGADGDRLRVLFVSVDSERDTPAALKSYLASFDKRIVGLTGSAAEIAGAAGAFDAFYEKITNANSITFDHTAKAYLVNRDGRVAASVDLLRTPDAERRRVLRALLSEP